MFAPNRMGLGMRPSQPQYSAPPAQPPPAPGMTTLFVGSISSGITDDFLTTLFSACGQLRSFKRLLTPIGKPQGFGFAEFESPEAMVRAIELLNGQELPSLEPGQPVKKLLVRADAKTGDFLSAWQSQRIKTDADEIQTETSRTLIQGLLDSARTGDLTRTLQSVEEANNANSAPVSAHLHDLQEADLPENQRGLVISEIALFRERAQKRDKNGEPIKIAGVGPVNAANRNNSTVAQPPTGPSRGWGPRAGATPTGPAAASASPAAPVPASPAPTTSSSRPQDSRADPQSYSRGAPEFVKGTSKKTDEERDRELRANKARADEAEFRQRERIWEQNEYKRLKKLSHQVALENATRDAEEKDRYEMKTRLEIWDDDESDELFYTDRIKWRANRARQLFSENRADADSRAIDAAEEERVRRESELFLERQMEAIRVTQEEQKKAGLLIDDTAPLKISVQVATSKPAEKKVEDASKVVFGQEEDEDTVVKKRRGPLIELDFAMDKERAAEKLETIRTQVTKDKDTLWKAKVRWEAISDGMIDSKLDAIVKRKVIHYLGDNDEDLAMFVNEHLKDHKGPGKLAEGLEPVLDTDATEFVTALWRQIIFESVAYGEGLETRNLLVD